LPPTEHDADASSMASQRPFSPRRTMAAVPDRHGSFLQGRVLFACFQATKVSVAA
jgi:hypothetical protein